MTFLSPLRNFRLKFSPFYGRGNFLRKISDAQSCSGPFSEYGVFGPQLRLILYGPLASVGKLDICM